MHLCRCRHWDSTTKGWRRWIWDQGMRVQVQILAVHLFPLSIYHVQIFVIKCCSSFHETFLQMSSRNTWHQRCILELINSLVCWLCGLDVSTFDVIYTQIKFSCCADEIHFLSTFRAIFCNCLTAFSVPHQKHRPTMYRDWILLHHEALCPRFYCVYSVWFLLLCGKI